jgi:hypothetical protein
MFQEHTLTSPAVAIAVRKVTRKFSASFLFVAFPLISDPYDAKFVNIVAQI